MKAVIDSDVLIDFLQGNPRAADEIARYDDLCCSVVSWMEVMCGADTEPEIAAAKGLMESMRVVELSSRVAHLAVEGRRKHRLKIPDAVIWATADSEGCILVTRNTKDFDKEHPMIRIPY
jgi:predicted nucleic acid-binding protein